MRSTKAVSDAPTSVSSSVDEAGATEHEGVEQSSYELALALASPQEDGVVIVSERTACATAAGKSSMK